MLVACRQPVPRRLIFGIGKHRIVQHFGGPAIVALIEGFLPDGQRRILSPDGLDEPAGFCFQRMGIERGRNAIPPSEIALIDGLRIVVQRAVIPARVEMLGLDSRLGQIFCNLELGFPAIGAPHGLVVRVPIDIPLAAQEGLDILLPEGRPVMRREHDIRALAIFGQHIIDHPAPFQQVADLGAAQGERIVEGGRGDFCGTQRVEVRQIKHEFCRCLRAGRVDEFKCHAINHAKCAPAGYLFRRLDQADCPL